MASYWQTAKRKAKQLANLHGYCWVWPNPAIDWKRPYLFHESEVGHRPPFVPETAYLFEGPPPYVEPELTIDERIYRLECEIIMLKGGV